MKTIIEEGEKYNCPSASFKSTGELSSLDNQTIHLTNAIRPVDERHIHKSLVVHCEQSSSKKRNRLVQK